MNFVRLAVLALLAGLCSIATVSAEDAHWGYSGPEGPGGWSKLKDGAACAGPQQSPIDLKSPFKGSLERIAIRWQRFIAEVENNGHTITAKAPAGSYTTFGGQRFDLLQVHFHHRSEHTIEGKQYPLEAHFVHRAADGRLLVLGVMLDSGTPSVQIQKIWSVMPSTKGSAQTRQPLDLAFLIPKDGNVYRYAGSLTTPPCSEIVSWVVFARPLQVSRAQIDQFAKLYPVNNRPVQPLNRRFVLFGR